MGFEVWALKSSIMCTCHDGLLRTGAMGQDRMVALRGAVEWHVEERRRISANECPLDFPSSISPESGGIPSAYATHLLGYKVDRGYNYMVSTAAAAAAAAAAAVGPAAVEGPAGELYISMGYSAGEAGENQKRGLYGCPSERWTLRVIKYKQKADVHPRSSRGTFQQLRLMLRGQTQH
eukprot:scaffold11862_cov21-Tisochrysis_lutea.AAC.2